MSNQPEDARVRRPFAAFIHEQRGGNLHGELTEALADLVLAVSEHRAKGVLQLQIIITPNNDGATVTVSDKLKLTIPEGDRGAAIFFVDDDGNLTRQNPRQIELPLREVGEKKTAAGE